MSMRYLLVCCSAVALFAQSTDLTQALQSSRQRIDSIDEQIVKLLNERAQVVHEVGVIKKKFNAPVSAPGREEQVVHRAAGQARAPLTGPAVEAIYRTILREMSAMEQAEVDGHAR
ncbi:MAG TPA: chorismate mutase [Bryobacteraceae bacterium]|nr:chorismate mutase [Bryobacteraceae bacterium]